MEFQEIIVRQFRVIMSTAIVEVVKILKEGLQGEHYMNLSNYNCWLKFS